MLLLVRTREDWACFVMLTGSSGVTAEWLVDSINGLTERGGITEQWVGLILLVSIMLEVQCYLGSADSSFQPIGMFALRPYTGFADRLLQLVMLPST